ncbi:MAG TPA: hypothetical protein VGN17_28620 [Bryobacteraceae bacterium]|jgi:hypothetical protein
MDQPKRIIDIQRERLQHEKADAPVWVLDSVLSLETCKSLEAAMLRINGQHHGGQTPNPDETVRNACAQVLQILDHAQIDSTFASFPEEVVRITLGYAIRFEWIPRPYLQQESDTDGIFGLPWVSMEVFEQRRKALIPSFSNWAAQQTDAGPVSNPATPLRPTPEQILDAYKAKEHLSSWEAVAEKCRVKRDTILAIKNQKRWVSDGSYESVARTVGVEESDLHPQTLPRPSHPPRRDLRKPKSGSKN